MKPVALAAIFVASAAIAWGAGVVMLAAFDPDKPLARLGVPQFGTIGQEIERNEAECRKEQAPGTTAYVVTRWGVLRGCLVVPDNADPRSPPRHLFVWKRPPL